MTHCTILPLRLRIKVFTLAKKTGTAVQEMDMVEMRTKLTRSLARFRLMHTRYMPLVLPFLSHRVVPEEEEVESVPLLLPSSLACDERELCEPSLGEIERQLRDARCRRFLDELRNLLFIKSRLVGYKDRNARHQGANTRTRTLINRNEEKIKLQVDRYRTAWGALKRLGGDGNMGVQLQELKQEHIQCMEDPDSLTKKHVRRIRCMEKGREDAISIPNQDRRQGDGDEDDEDGDDTEELVVGKEGYRMVSWIWMDGSGTSEGMDGMNEGRPNTYHKHKSLLILSLQPFMLSGQRLGRVYGVGLKRSNSSRKKCVAQSSHYITKCGPGKSEQQ